MWRYLISITIVAAAVVVLIWFGEPVDRQVVFNTLLLGFGTSLLSVPTGLLLARVCLNRGLLPTLIRWSSIALLFMPVFLHVSAWDSAFGKLGWVTWTANSGFNVLTGQWPIAIWIHSMAAIPQLTVILWFGLLASGRTYEEQASLDADERTVFWQITFPRLLPILAIAIVWVFVTCAREIAVTDIYRIGTLAEQIYLGYSLGELDATVGNLTTVALIVVATGMVVASLFNLDVPSTAEELSVQTRQAGNSNWQNGLSIVMLVLVGLPVLNLMIRAGSFVHFTDGQAVAHYSFGHAWQGVARVPSVFASEIAWSSTIALSSCLLSLTLATLAFWFSIHSKFCRVIFLLSVAICSGLPGPLIGSSLLWLRSIGESSLITWLFDRTIFAPVIANILFCWPVCSVLVWFVLRNTARDSLEHAKMEGASSISRLLRIVVAGNKLGLLGVAIIIFAHSFGELSASQLAVPPGMDTVPRRMLGMLHSGVNDHTAGLTIVIVGFTIVLVAIGSVFLRFNRQRYLNLGNSSK